MGSSLYPNAIDGYQQIRIARDRVDEIVASDHNSERSAIIKIEQTLGIRPQSIYGTVNARLDAIEEAGGVENFAKVKVSANDSTPDWLGSKVFAGRNINTQEAPDGGNEKLIIRTDPTLLLPEQAADPASGADEGYIYTKEKNGQTELYYMDDSGATTQLTGIPSADIYKFKISGDDTTPRYFAQKVTSGLNIVATVLNPAGDEDLQVATAETLSLPEQGAAPASAADTGSIYTEQASGVTELFYIDDYGTTTQLTNSGAPSPYPFNTVGGDLTIPDGYGVVAVDTSAANVTVTLPLNTAIAAGTRYIFKKTQAANNMIIQGNGGATIDGSANLTVNIRWSAYTVLNDGTNWLII